MQMVLQGGKNTLVKRAATLLQRHATGAQGMTFHEALQGLGYPRDHAIYRPAALPPPGRSARLFPA